MSSYTIEKLLSKSDEGQRTLTSNLNFEKSFNTNNNKMVTDARHGTDIEGACAAPFSYAYNHQYFAPCSGSTALYGAVGGWRYDAVLLSRPMTLQGRCGCCCRAWNAIRNNGGEQNTWITESCITNLKHSPIRVSIEESPIARDPMPEFQESQLPIDERTEFKEKETRMNRKYEWMVNPRPFYRRGKKLSLS